MKTRYLLCAAAAGLAAVSCAQTPGEQVDRLLSKAIRNDEPGVAAMVIHKGRVEYRKGFGLANLERKLPIAPRTQFLLASVTKQFTAMGILIAASQGKLRYDDPLSKFIPEFPPYARQITVRHLLQHLSGLPDYEELLVGKTGPGFFRPSTSPPAEHEYTAAEALTVLAGQPKLRFTPGEKFEYSNSGYVVLAQILERVFGMRYAEFMAQHIFSPLGMKDTLVYDERKQKAARLALSYARVDGGWQDNTYSPLNWIYGEDNVITTLEDMYRWDQALYTEKLIPRSALELAFTPGRTNDGKETAYGFGWRVLISQGRRILAHSGSWAGYRNYIQRVPEEQLTIVILSNRASLPKDVPDLPKVGKHLATSRPQ